MIYSFSMSRCFPLSSSLFIISSWKCGGLASFGRILDTSSASVALFAWKVKGGYCPTPSQVSWSSLFFRFLLMFGGCHIKLGVFNTLLNLYFVPCYGRQIWVQSIISQGAGFVDACYGVWYGILIGPGCLFRVVYMMGFWQSLSRSKWSSRRTFFRW